MNWLLKIKLNSIYTKLLATYLLLTTLGTSVMSGYILWSFYAYFMKARQIEMYNWNTAIKESVADALDANDRKRVELIVQRYGAPENITLRVFNNQGKLIATSSPKQDQQVTNWLVIPGVYEGLKNRETEGLAKAVLSNDDRLFIAQPIVRNGQFMGVLRMSITLQQFQSQFATVIWTVMATLFSTLLLCTIISEWLARSLSRPIKTMKNFAIRLGSGHFGDKLQIRQSNELDQLAVELNRMSERLASLDQERRSFLANVSHELRTPISNVLVTVEALRNGAIADSAVSDRFLRTVEDESKRLSRLIDDLLDLGRLEAAGVKHLQKQPIQLSSLINRAVRAMETRMQNSQISVQVNVTDLQIQGDSERLLQALLNLLDNAIKHSSPDSQIFIATYKEGRQAMITIRDQGQGIRDSDVPRIFEQFYTGDRSRQGRGVGLGLAITKRIIEAHNGSITFTTQVGQGTTFIIYLPL